MATLLSLFESADLRLPYFETEDDKSYLYHYDFIMNKYLEKIISLPEDLLHGYNKDAFLENVDFIIREIKESISLHLNGFPARAYERFSRLIDEADLTTQLIHFRTIQIDTNHCLYRIKREYNTDNLLSQGYSNGFIDVMKPLDLFHVPFQKRRIIGTNRFSIPGFPCIYLSDSLHTSWSECMNNEAEAFHAICFKNHRPLYMVDLVPLNFLRRGNTDMDYVSKIYNNTYDNDTVMDYAVVYPLIMACHSKLRYTPTYPGEIQFKSEYIIPQLLLQWYREQNLMVDGIRYLSCTAEERFPNKEFNKFNYVIPATEIKETGHCLPLLLNYSTSPVYSYLHANYATTDDMLDAIIRSLIEQKFSPLYHN